MAFNYNPDFKAFTKMLWPHFLRKEKMRLFVHSAVQVIQDLNDTFFAFRESNALSVKTTAQVIYLEKYLNDTYDNSLRRIYITHPTNASSEYVHNDGEPFTDSYYLHQESYFTNPPSYDKYLHSNSEFDAEYDYVINWPVAVTYDDDEVRGNVDKYNLIGKRYNIVTF